MTDRDDILNMAKKAGFTLLKRRDGESLVYVCYDTDIIRFFGLARQRPGWKWVPNEADMPIRISE